MHKNSIWTSYAGLSILAAESVNVIVVFALFEIFDINNGIPT